MKSTDNDVKVHKLCIPIINIELQQLISVLLFQADIIIVNTQPQSLFKKEELGSESCIYP